jgi:hypothetical protein
LISITPRNYSYFADIKKRGFVGKNRAPEHPQADGISPILMLIAQQKVPYMHSVEKEKNSVPFLNFMAEFYICH